MNKKPKGKYLTVMQITIAGTVIPANTELLSHYESPHDPADYVAEALLLREGEEVPTRRVRFRIPKDYVYFQPPLILV